MGHTSIDSRIANHSGVCYSILVKKRHWHLDKHRIGQTPLRKASKVSFDVKNSYFCYMTFQ